MPKAPKPQPKELVVEKGSTSIVNVTTNGLDAKNFIEKEAPTFGDLIELHKEANLGNTKEFYILIYANYDVDEVVEYLKNYIQD